MEDFNDSFLQLSEKTETYLLSKQCRILYHESYILKSPHSISTYLDWIFCWERQRSDTFDYYVPSLEGKDQLVLEVEEDEFFKKKDQLGANAICKKSSHRFVLQELSYQGCFNWIHE